ncbi:MarR family transcriptional regulator [Aquihabitans sp. G128]|uniref:MarR family winged helix-turn-helix transcriptional regulator n=1 Tax=Aquihabitans sp. G128 TaxID=2849779 RepID=UPI001C2158A8|nr:MarR family transcriptional regulator [Aquihabitans sp. G128]QXC62488.1 MarR family transcriptional regulator [Aquihabitans sp. G128]
MDPAGDAAAPMLADDRLTAMGLLVETAAGVTDVFERELEGLGISGSAFEVMIRLARSPERRLRMTELAAQSTLTNSGLTRLVDRLDQAGLVTREPCETDRRGFFAILTPAGLAKLGGVLPSHLHTVDRILTGVLDPDELDVLLRALRKVRAVVKPTSDPAVAAAVADG